MDESPLFTRAYDLLRESLIQSAGAHQEILELGACNYNSKEITGLAGSRGRDRSGEFRKAGVAVEGAVFVEPSVAGETAGDGQVLRDGGTCTEVHAPFVALTYSVSCYGRCAAPGNLARDSATAALAST